MMIQTQTSKMSKTLYRTGSTGSGAHPAPPARLPSRYYSPALSRGNGNGHANGSSNGNQPSNGRKKSARSGRMKLWSPWKLILLSIALGLAGSVYLTHVFETQNALREVQQLRREYERTHRVHTEVRRNYDRMTGPAEVYNRAASIGMISGGAADPVIVIDR